MRATVRDTDNVVLAVFEATSAAKLTLLLYPYLRDHAQATFTVHFEQAIHLQQAD